MILGVVISLNQKMIVVTFLFMDQISNQKNPRTEQANTRQVFGR